MPIVVHVPAPAGERWNTADVTPEPASAGLEDTVTLLPCSTAPAAGAVTEPVGEVESLVKMSDVVELLPAASAPCTPSVGELVVPADQANELVETWAARGRRPVWLPCVQPVVVPPSAGKNEDAGPEPESETLFEIWKLPAATPR